MSMTIDRNNFKNWCERGDHDRKRQARAALSKLEDPEKFAWQTDGVTPLHLACRFLNTNILKVIFDFGTVGCRPNVKHNLGRSALHEALSYLKVDKIREKTSFFEVAIPFFAQHGFDWKGNVDCDRNTVLHICAKNGFVDVLEIMIRHNVARKMLMVTNIRQRTPRQIVARQHQACKKKKNEAERNIFAKFQRKIEELIALEHVIEFRGNSECPWGVGINFMEKPKRWRVTTLKPGKQFHAHGVCIDWRILKVNQLDVKKHHRSIIPILKQGLKCTITFLGAPPVQFHTQNDKENEKFLQRVKAHGSSVSTSTTQSNPRGSKSTSIYQEAEISRQRHSHSSKRQTHSHSSKQRHSSHSTSISRNTVRPEMGRRVTARFNDGKRYPGYISKVEPNLVMIRYDGYRLEEIVPENAIPTLEYESFVKGQLVKKGTKLLVVTKTLPGGSRLCECSCHGKSMGRQEYDTLTQLMVGETVYAPYPDDKQTYKAVIDDYDLKQKTIYVKYEGYEKDPTTQLTEKYFHDVYTIQEWNEDVEEDKEYNMNYYAIQEPRPVVHKPPRSSPYAPLRSSPHAPPRSSPHAHPRSNPHKQPKSTTHEPPRSSTHDPLVCTEPSRERSIPIELDWEGKDTLSPPKHQQIGETLPEGLSKEEQERIRSKLSWKVLDMLPKYHGLSENLPSLLRSAGMTSNQFWSTVAGLDQFCRDMHKEITKDKENALKQQKQELEMDKENALKQQKQELEMGFLSRNVDSIIMATLQEYKNKWVNEQERREKVEEDKQKLDKRLQVYAEENSTVRETNECQQAEIERQRILIQKLNAENNTLRAQKSNPSEEESEKMQNLEKENKELRIQFKAQICLCDKDIANHIALPCGHFQYCDLCTQMEGFEQWKESRKCTICNEFVKEFRRLWR